MRDKASWGACDAVTAVEYAVDVLLERAFEVQLRRMVGLDDGVTDALFRFTRPVTGCAFWCPPVKKGKLDLSAVGI